MEAVQCNTQLPDKKGKIWQDPLQHAIVGFAHASGVCPFSTNHTTIDRASHSRILTCNYVAMH